MVRKLLENSNGNFHFFNLETELSNAFEDVIKNADFPEQVREMIEVFESREEMQQDTIAKKMISLDHESVCLSVTEYYGLIVSTMLLLALLMTVAVIIGLLYK
jgi:1,4-dihydroxy-2-naphthoate octaprenyltransferase